jgi:hypothetical protein
VTAIRETSSRDDLRPWAPPRVGVPVERRLWPELGLHGMRAGLLVGLVLGSVGIAVIVHQNAWGELAVVGVFLRLAENGNQLLNDIMTNARRLTVRMRWRAGLLTSPGSCLATAAITRHIPAHSRHLPAPRECGGFYWLIQSWCPRLRSTGCT